MSPSIRKTNQTQQKAQDMKETNRDKQTMKGRESKGAPPADLFVCFPSRSHLTRPICSPARSTELTKRHHHLGRSGNRPGQASPLLWAKTKSMGPEIAEPTSPKVSCAGQIKVRSKTSSSKNWQSVMEEIERLHNTRKQNKRPTWVETPRGLKKDMMHLFTSLRSHRFNFQCFGSFHESDVTSVDDEVVVDQENQVGVFEGGDGSTSRAIFSKWFMVLQENKNNGFSKEGRNEKDKEARDGSCDEVCAPPPNALLLMRCRSAPAKNWFEENQQKQEEEAKKANLVLEEHKKTESLILKCFAPDFFKASTDIATETWVVGGMKDPLSRSRSWKR